MARTTVAEVKAITGSTATNTVITAYINSATALVDVVLGSTVSTDISTQIEMWLAAHMLTVSRERLIKKAGAGDGVAVEYAGMFGKGLDATQYGQMVKELDTTGSFAALGRKSAWIRAITTDDFE